MTFLEAALEILRRERKPLHYKDITTKAMDKKLLTFVGRTPEVTMQTQLTAAVKKTPGNPFVRVKPGTFGLLRYPEAAAAPPEDRPAPVAKVREAKSEEVTASAGATDERGRRRRRGGRGRSRRDEAGESGSNLEARTQAALAVRGRSAEEPVSEEDENTTGEGPDEPEIGSMSAEDRAAALAESGVLSALDDDDDAEGESDEESDEDGDDEDEAAVSASPAEDDVEPAGEDDDDDDEDGDDDDDEDEDDDDDDDDDEEEEASPSLTPPPAAGASASAAPSGGLRRGRDDEEGEVEVDLGQGMGQAPLAGRAAGAFAGEGGTALAGPAGPGFEDSPGGRRRRRRRRRRGGGVGESGFEGGAEENGARPASSEPSNGEGAEGAAAGAVPASEGVSLAGGESADAGASRRIMSPVDAAIEILRGQAPGRGMHVRQLADAATRRRLVHGEANEAWRVMRAALAAEPRERLRAGQRPRIRAAGSGLFSLSRRPPDLDLERAEHVFGEARRALRERTIAALEQRLVELSPSAFEAITRVLLQREGFGPATFVKRVEGTVYLEALRGRGIRPSRALIALRPGGIAAGRRAIGELRAGIRARNQDEGVLLLGGRLAEDGIAEWKQPGPPIEVADGAALAETCLRHGVGVINTMVSVDFVDADFFAEMQEG